MIETEDILRSINQLVTFFKKMHKLKIDNNLSELSMGMSSDYVQALVCGSTYLRIGSAIFK